MVEIDSSSSEAEPRALEAFREVAEGLVAAAQGLIGKLDVDAFAVRFVLIGDFRGQVERRLRTLGHPCEAPFTTSRLAGEAVAKYLRVDPERRECVVVVDDRWWRDDSGAGRAEGIYVLAHEVSHCFIERVRAEAGTAGLFERCNRMGQDDARLIALHAADEFRADVLADAFLSVMVTIEVDGAARPLASRDLVGAAHLERLCEIIEDEVCPGWPDLVQQYREHCLPLEDMARALIESTDQVLCVLAHTDAVVASDRESVLDRELVEYRGAEIYLGDVWQPILERMRATVLPQDVNELAEADRFVARTGEAGVLGLWRKLGVTFEPLPGGSTYIKVDAPER